MIKKEFWEDVRNVWIIEIPQQLSDTKTASGIELDAGDMEGIPFDEVDFDEAVMIGLNGGNYAYNSRYRSKPAPKSVVSPTPQPVKMPEKRQKPKLDDARFEAFMDRQTLPDYMEACKLLLHCELPEKMKELDQKLIERMAALQDSITKFESLYQADLSQFYEYYIPETLQLTASYLEYIDMDIEENTIKETEKEVVEATEKLILGLKDKMEEISRFASIELRAKAKALESMMSQNGYVDPDFKIN